MCGELVFRSPAQPGTAVLAALLLALTALDVSAQACVRSSESGIWVGGSAARQSSGNAFGGEFGWQTLPTLALVAEVDRATFEARDPSRTTARAGVVLRLPMWEIVCGSAAYEYEVIGDRRAHAVPAGVTFSANVVPAGETGWRLIPFVEPRLTYRTANIAGFTRTRTSTSIRGGAVVGFNAVYLGLDYEHRAAAGAPAVLRARLGLNFW
jgi:hypothetical protein